MLNYSGYPTFSNIKCYGVIDFNTEDHNVMVHVVIIISQILMI